VSTAPSAPFSAWAKTMRRLAQQHATHSEPVAVESSTAPTEARRSRWPWVIGLGTAAASLCVALIAVGVILGRGNDTGSPDPQPPNVSTWWALRTACAPNPAWPPGPCFDDADHAKLSAGGGQKPVVLNLLNGAWQSRPETMLFACLGPDGAPAKQTTTQVIWLQHAQGALRGAVAQPKRSGKFLSAKVLLGNLISGW
jgi:hypothetical protein